MSVVSCILTVGRVVFSCLMGIINVSGEIKERINRLC